MHCVTLFWNLFYLTLFQAALAGVYVSRSFFNPEEALKVSQEGSGTLSLPSSPMPARKGAERSCQGHYQSQSLSRKPSVIAKVGVLTLDFSLQPGFISVRAQFKLVSSFLTTQRWRLREKNSSNDFISLFFFSKNYFSELLNLAVKVIIEDLGSV
jgi:hypothetical protein